MKKCHFDDSFKRRKTSSCGTLRNKYLGIENSASDSTLLHTDQQPTNLIVDHNQGQVLGRKKLLQMNVLLYIAPLFMNMN